jgi:endonuclease YncB( thermonuclease family)
MKLACLTRIVTRALFVTMCLPLCHGDSSALISKKPTAFDGNGSLASVKIIRVIQPGIFDVQTADYIVRMRAWGVSFPKRDQPGYAEALSFTENRLVLMTPELKIKREFDEQNLKVVDILLLGGKMNFSREAIGAGVGWHLEKESNRYGPFVIAQLKAKRMNLGIWANNFNYGRADPFARPNPQLPNMLKDRNTFVPSLNYWVSSLGKIHRPGCSFYERGNGVLTSRPNGRNCRICGGSTPK